MMTIPGRIPISIHPLFWLLALLIGWMYTFTLAGTLLAVLVVFISVLFHEFGHALTGTLFGQKTRIELAAFGGFTYRQGRKLKLWEEFLVVINGPLAGLLLCVGAYLLMRFVPITSPPVAFVVKFTMIANLFWTVMNLVPVLPLDGGHLLSIVLEGIFGFKGVKMAIVIGLVIGVGLSIYLLTIRQLLLGLLFLILTFESFRSLRYYRVLTEKDRDEELQKFIRQGEELLKQGKEDEALKAFEEVRNRTRAGVLYLLATQQMAELYRRRNGFKEAYELLLPVRKNLTGEGLVLLHFLASKNQDNEMVARVGNEVFQANPTAETALRNAYAYGALGQVEPAVGWLECALRQGLTSVDEILQKPEFDPIRHEKRFQNLAK